MNNGNEPMISEGLVKRGGLNVRPPTPKPDVRPVGQQPESTPTTSPKSPPKQPAPVVPAVGKK